MINENERDGSGVTLAVEGKADSHFAYLQDQDCAVLLRGTFTAEELRELADHAEAAQARKGK